MQGTGLGKALYAQALAEAERSGTRALYLLTTTAEPLFARAGFTKVNRARSLPPWATAPSSGRSARRRPSAW